MAATMAVIAATPKKTWATPTMHRRQRWTVERLALVPSLFQLVVVVGLGQAPARPLGRQPRDLLLGPLRVALALLQTTRTMALPLLVPQGGVGRRLRQSPCPMCAAGRTRRDRQCARGAVAMVGQPLLQATCRHRAQLLCQLHELLVMMALGGVFKRKVVCAAVGVSHEHPSHVDGCTDTATFPDWAPDESAVDCTLCQRAFSFFRRKQYASPR